MELFFTVTLVLCVSSATAVDTCLVPFTCGVCFCCFCYLLLCSVVAVTVFTLCCFDHFLLFDILFSLSPYNYHVITLILHCVSSFTFPHVYFATKKSVYAKFRLFQLNLVPVGAITPAAAITANLAVVIAVVTACCPVLLPLSCPRKFIPRLPSNFVYRIFTFLINFHFL